MPRYFAELCLTKFSDKSQNNMKRTQEKLPIKTLGGEDESDRTIIW